MILSLSIAAALAERCAPTVARETLLAVAYHESGLDTLAIGDNSSGKRLHPSSRLEAVATARALIASGHNIDMGIGQINSRTAPRLGLTVFAAFDACRNMAAAGALMERSYRSVAGSAPAQRSIATMLSIYNTGNSRRGFDNGYVDRVYRAAATIVPRLRGVERMQIDVRQLADAADVGEPLGSPRATVARSTIATVAADPPPPSPPPPWVAFGNPADVMVFADGRAAAGMPDTKEKPQ